jgi:phage protein D
MGYHVPMADAQRLPDEPEPLRLMLAGIITKLAPAFPAGGQPTLKVSGTNALIKMITKQETHTYAAGKRDSEIAEEVGRRGNLTLRDLRIGVRVDDAAKSSEAVHPEAVLQSNQYDILFLLQLAHRNGYDLVLQQQSRGGVTEQFLFFGPSTKHPPVTYLLEWGKSLAQFQPTLTTARQVNELTVLGWDSQRRQPINVTVNRSQLPTRPLRDEDRLYRIQQGFRERQEIVVDQPFRNEAEARRFGLDKLERLSKDMVTARGSTLGTPDLRAGRKCQVQKLGRTFDGHYFIKSTTHTIGSGGYVTEFEARAEEEQT